MYDNSRASIMFESPARQSGQWLDVKEQSCKY
jgi:hypothetical protein